VRGARVEERSENTERSDSPERSENKALPSEASIQPSAARRTSSERSETQARAEGEQALPSGASTMSPEQSEKKARAEREGALPSRARRSSSERREHSVGERDDRPPSASRMRERSDAGSPSSEARIQSRKHSSWRRRARQASDKFKQQTRYYGPTLRITRRTRNQDDGCDSEIYVIGCTRTVEPRLRSARE
jgi:hypothetical protein